MGFNGSRLRMVVSVFDSAASRKIFASRSRFVRDSFDRRFAISTSSNTVFVTFNRTKRKVECWPSGCGRETCQQMLRFVLGEAFKLRNQGVLNLQREGSDAAGVEQRAQRQINLKCAPYARKDSHRF